MLHKDRPDSSTIRSSLMIKGSLKLGIARIRVVVMADFNFWNALSASEDQKNLPFFNKLVNGLAIIP